MLHGTEYANATMKTIRLHLIKVAAYVKEIKTRIKIELPKQFPDMEVVANCLGKFNGLRCWPSVDNGWEHMIRHLIFQSTLRKTTSEAKGIVNNPVNLLVTVGFQRNRAKKNIFSQINPDSPLSCPLHEKQFSFPEAKGINFLSKFGLVNNTG